MLRTRSITLTALVLGSWTAGASYIQNRGLQPLGEQEAFLANTGVAAQGSPGAPIYNPAGLATLESFKLSAEGSVFQKASASSASFLRVDGTNLDLKLSGLSPIPGTVMGSQRLWGQPVGFYVLVPDLLELRARKAWTTPNTRTAFVTNQVSKDLWIGGSTAFRLGEAWSVGFSVAGIQHSEVSTLVVDMAYPDSASPPELVSITGDFESSVTGLVLTAGALYAPSRRWSLGLRLQSPLVRLAGSGSGQTVSNRLRTSSGTSTLERVFDDDPNIRANWRLPADLLAGFSYRLDEAWLLLGDLGVQFPTSYDPYPDSAFSLSVRTRDAWRASLGLAWQWTPRFRWLTGLQYNQSSSILEAGEAAEGSTDTPYWGTTLGLQSRLGPVTSGFGVYYQAAAGRTSVIGSGELETYKETRWGALLTFSYEFDRFMPRIEATTTPVVAPGP